MNIFNIVGLILTGAGAILGFVGNSVESQKLTDKRLDKVFGEQGKDEDE